MNVSQTLSHSLTHIFSKYRLYYFFYSKFEYVLCVLSESLSHSASHGCNRISFCVQRRRSFYRECRYCKLKIIVGFLIIIFFLFSFVSFVRLLVYLSIIVITLISSSLCVFFIFCPLLPTYGQFVLVMTGISSCRIRFLIELFHTGTSIHQQIYANIQVEILLNIAMNT